MDEDAFADGIMFDGSSIAGWKVINESDMKLMPDPSSAVLDPFFAQSTLAVFCDVLEPLTNEPYERDPRAIAGKAQNYLKQTGVGDTAVFGPEAEFFVFDDVRFKAEPFNCGYKLNSIELPSNMDTEYEMGNLGHRPRTKGGYFPVPPIDSAQDLRSEMLAVMADMGVVTEKHHHEVGAAQHELGIKFGPLVKTADSMQIYKYVIHQVAQAYGKTATFMPKPVYRRQRLGHAHAPVDLEGRQAAVRRRQICRPVGHGAALHRRHPEARQGAQRLSPTRSPTPTSGWCRATRRRCCSPIPRATARPRAAFRWARAPRPSASRSASPIRAPIPISPSPPC